jgi:hypothetical protein
VRCRGRWGAKVPWGYNAASLGGPKRADRFQIGPESLFENWLLGRANVLASPDSQGFSKRLGLARTLALPRLGFQTGSEAAGPGTTAPRLEPEASLEVPSAERFTPYLSAIHD